MEHTKRCTKCGETKPIVEFHKDKHGGQGVRGQCKVCKTVANKKYLATKRGAKARRKSVKRYLKTDKWKATTRAYRARREEQQRLATPPWAPLHIIADIYREADRLTLESGVKHEVHHIMPLLEFSSLFVGLHVPWNLEILPIDEHMQAHADLKEAYSRASREAARARS